MTEPQLNRLAREWMVKLRLQDWRVKVEYNNNIGSYARCTPSTSFQTARIQLKDPTLLLDGGTVACRDLEVNLVHELLHLHCFIFDKKLLTDDGKEGEHYWLLERMIELTAQALVWCKRGTSPTIN